MAGQTLTEIRRLLAGAGLAPQHRYGQNFLVDLNLMRKLVAAADVTAADTLLEVGPGTGSLTELLLESGAHVIAVEIDRGLQELLRDRLGSQPRFTLVQGDVLASKHTLNPLVLHALAAKPPAADGSYKLVANLPYQIATPLLVDLLLSTVEAGGSPAFARLTCTIQKEVGERLGARPRCEEYGPVSVLVQTFARVAPLAILPPSVFWPRPQVESVMLTIEPRTNTATPEHPHPTTAQARPDTAPPRTAPQHWRSPREFARFVQSAFQQRRKTLRRLFRDWPELDVLRAFNQAGISMDARPEELAPDQWQLLFAASFAVRPNSPADSAR
jgi:16S rRNA (adenine1518-N6/adenine1519-N6)-dimethyltransferase